MTERTVAAPDGVPIFVRDMPAEGGEIGLPALCIHGLTRNSKDFEIIQPRIAAGGRRCLAMDVRGRGLSGRDRDPRRYRIDVYVEDVLAVLDAFGIERAAFVGTSMGGLITMATAGRAPERIERAVLNDIGPALEQAGLDRIAGYVGTGTPAASWAEAAARIRAINASAFPDADDTFWDAFARRTFREREGGIELDYDPEIAAAFREPDPDAPLLPDPWTLFDALARRPVLIVRGALSDLFSAQTAQQMTAHGPAVQVVEVPDVGHAPMLDEPAAWEALSRFLGLRD